MGTARNVLKTNGNRGGLFQRLEKFPVAFHAAGQFFHADRGQRFPLGLAHIKDGNDLKGRNLYFLGANMEAAKMAGIRTRRIRFAAHVICGICAGIAGVLVVARVNSASIQQGLNYEMDAMACVAVGGTSLNGGSGSILKVVLGVVVLGVLLNALNLLGVQANEQLIVRGADLLDGTPIFDIWNKKAKLKEVAK